jgi:hypothetical protein
VININKARLASAETARVNGSCRIKLAVEIAMVIPASRMDSQCGLIFSCQLTKNKQPAAMKIQILNAMPNGLLKKKKSTNQARIKPAIKNREVFFIIVLL